MVPSPFALARTGEREGQPYEARESMSQCLSFGHNALGSERIGLLRERVLRDLGTTLGI
jgi:hypothetical protein